MPPQSRSLTLFAALFSCGWAAAGARAELIKVSPFLPPQTAQAAPTSNAPLEYRGSMEVGSVETYRIVDPAKKVGTWLKVGDKDENLGIVLKTHDKDRDTIVVEQGSQSMTLPLRVPKVISSGNAPQMLAPAPVANPGPNVPPAVTQAVVPNPTPADEQRRLEAVAAEVARRRALREQAAQQAQQNGQPANVPPPNVTRQDLQNAQSQIRR